ncbi:MAG TPA: V-type ATPase 116kDa subunit family protein [Kofleriaceae bacterium]|nr:V-type ATPase 116kDa subunit family protein [Kofleriaceae bacterium]
MARIRVLGPLAALAATTRALQDAGVVHVIDAACPPGLVPRTADATVRRRRRHLTAALAELEATLTALAELGAPVSDDTGVCPAKAAIARRTARVRRQVDELARRQRALVDERDALRAYEPLFHDLEGLLASDRKRAVSVYLLRLHGDTALAELRGALDRVIGEAHVLRSYTLATGEQVALLLVSAARAELIDRQLSEARVDRAPLPPGFGGLPLSTALARMRPRLAEVIAELGKVGDEAMALARTEGPDLARARRGFHDALLALGAEEHAATSGRVFVLEGWLPARERGTLATALARDVGLEVTIEEVGRDEWRGEDAPVVLANPKLFAPFEVLTSLLPLPRYGSVDPTPFVAVFFPMFFGVIVGDVGYGALMFALALILRLASKPHTAARSIARIITAVAVYAVLFGICYGELFGDLGTQLFGMHAVWFDRREAVLAFLALAVALGVVHLLLGLIVAAANRWRRDRKEAIGRGLTAAMLVLLVVALLALFEQLPKVFVTPAVIAMLVTLPIIVILEGATALLDLMTIVGHVLSYARVMALGTASVMLAVVANRMGGAFGSVALGIAFALVFHLVNFAITLFSPTIHVMRLHYVEFFDTFFQPGGGPYQPLRHWSPSTVAT